jgi:hypothetical protein
MGRAFWIMDDIAPLRQLANARDTVSSATRLGPITGATGRVSGGGVRFLIGGEQLDLSKPLLLQPSSRVRYRAAGGGRRSGGPEYPPTALAIDYLLPEGFTGSLSLEITDGSGRVVRTVRPAAGRGGGDARGAPSTGSGQAPTASGDRDDPDMRAGQRGRGGAAALAQKPGHNRFMWDYRWANSGPLVAPGKYSVKLTAGDVTQTRTFEVRVDPGVVKDGTTVADLVEQQDFLLRLRDTIAEATRARQQIEQAMTKTGVQPPPAPGPGESTTDQIERLAKSAEASAKLQALWARIVTARGTYEQPMLLDQLNSINRVESGADQKVGMESRRRYDDLVKELRAIQLELAR